jgi:hypothetical protein
VAVFVFPSFLFYLFAVLVNNIQILRRLTLLSGVQEDILQRLGLGTALYRQLEIQEMGN